jgi:predicted cupin superfamily sugar epimerase
VKEKVDKRALELIDTLNLSLHPEGGYYKETFRSASRLVSPENKEFRNALTDIYFLLTAGQVSRFHRVLHDEIWHFYEGAPIALLEIQPNTLTLTSTQLSGKSNPPVYKYCVKGGNWQAAYSTGGYSLAGCTVAPGFDFSDFKCLKDHKPSLVMALEKYPHLAHLI